ncbi:hypothetical protein LOAG_01151 [Loa loa]|uniref:Uncharacterized protein n=1 Tax=Loa loa TaxID=7209 RepID=A0A1S0U9R0_LOALO|nr:hypothetical protein LOAG_01151 [Loa loa]EFO27333.1 hypothetical protein LOAG_01151 [Loa loa]
MDGIGTMQHPSAVKLSRRFVDGSHCYAFFMDHLYLFKYNPLETTIEKPSQSGILFALTYRYPIMMTHLCCCKIVIQPEIGLKRVSYLYGRVALMSFESIIVLYSLLLNKIFTGSVMGDDVS